MLVCGGMLLYGLLVVDIYYSMTRYPGLAHNT